MTSQYTFNVDAEGNLNVKLIPSSLTEADLLLSLETQISLDTYAETESKFKDWMSDDMPPIEGE